MSSEAFMAVMFQDEVFFLLVAPRSVVVGY
jgi:hypothetical protein